jgi:hypothetical protein
MAISEEMPLANKVIRFISVDSRSGFDVLYDPKFFIGFRTKYEG